MLQKLKKRLGFKSPNPQVVRPSSPGTSNGDRPRSKSASSGVSKVRAFTDAVPEDKRERSISAFREQFGDKACEDRLFYNFGAGDWRHPLVRNMDIVHPKYPKNKPDVEYDATSLKPFPIETGSGRVFYISHVNEHLPDEADAHIFAEMRRCLAPGGVLRIVYPNFDLGIRAYERDDRHFFLWERHCTDEQREKREKRPTAQLLLDMIATRAQVDSPDDGNRKFTAAEFEGLIDQYGYEGAADLVCKGMSLEAQAAAPGCHINWWNFSKMRRFLLQAGFSSVLRSSYRQSVCPPLRDPHYFDLRAPSISGYVDAIA